MAEYIKRETVREIMYHNQEALNEYQLNAIPAADVAPVRHGKWEFVEQNSRGADNGAN